MAHLKSLITAALLPTAPYLEYRRKSTRCPREIPKRQNHSESSDAFSRTRYVSHRGEDLFSSMYMISPSRTSLAF
jgi:hypothetical protein